MNEPALTAVCHGARPCLIAALAAGLMLAAGPRMAGAQPAAVATAAALAGANTETEFLLDMSQAVAFEIVTLASPYRVVIDLPGVAFRLPPSAGTTGRGLIKAYRYGWFAENMARVVIDTAGPVRIAAAVMTPSPGGAGARLSVKLAPTTKEAFGAGTGAARRPEPRGNSAESAPFANHKDRTKPLVMIDPGHGGIDPGAIGASNLFEKKIVLDVGLALKAALESTGRYEIRLTRDKDEYVSLDERVEMSRKAEADLFISLHADAIGGKNGLKSVRGASVYTLSEKPSDEEARLRAERENASDLLAGIAAEDTQERDEVADILIDLMKRETESFTADFAGVLVGKLRQTVALSRNPQKSAAFMVLKQTHAPSVLIELGYISHPEDERLMASAAWQKKVARAITQAVEVYFGKRAAAGALRPAGR